MELRPIPARGWADWYTQDLCASFPACECKPLEAIRALAAEGRYELLGLYDGAALLGYATLWSTPEWPDYVLLDYLGVTAARRNGGLGGAILKMLAAREAGLAHSCHFIIHWPGKTTVSENFYSPPKKIHRPDTFFRPSVVLHHRLRGDGGSEGVPCPGPDPASGVSLVLDGGTVGVLGRLHRHHAGDKHVPLGHHVPLPDRSLPPLRLHMEHNAIRLGHDVKVP